MSIAIIVHDPLDDSVSMHGDMWADIIAAFDIPHVYKVGGDRVSPFVPYGPEHIIPSKTVCVMTPAEALAANVESVKLQAYIHPDECTYVFGPDTDQRGWQHGFAGPDVDYVSVITPSATELYAFNAAAFILGNRFRIW